MRKSSYNNENEISKEECNIQTENNEQLINNNQRYMEEYIEEEVKDNPYNESESSREDDLPIKEGLFNETASVIKGLSLAFVFFFCNYIFSFIYVNSGKISKFNFCW